MIKRCVEILVGMGIIGVLLAGCGSEGSPSEQRFDAGVDFIKKGDFDKAIIELTKSIELDPHNARAFVKRGFAYAKKGKDVEAYKDFSQGYSIQPGIYSGDAESKTEYKRILNKYGVQLSF